MTAVERLVYTPAEAAEALGVSEQTIRARVREGRIPAIRRTAIGGRMLIGRKALERWVDESSGNWREES